MFTDTNYEFIHKVRQSELEAAAQAERLAAQLQNGEKGASLRQRIGSSLIAVGEKLTRDMEKDAKFVYSA